jgi:hypothetical protein
VRIPKPAEANAEPKKIPGQVGTAGQIFPCDPSPTEELVARHSLHAKAQFARNERCGEHLVCFLAGKLR